MTLEDILDVEFEIKRFEKRLKLLKQRIEVDGDWILRGCKETGAIKRGALDLKLELTKLTQ